MNTEEPEETCNDNTLICPHCGHEDQDAWELGPDELEGEYDHDCIACDKPMHVEKTATITYRATAKLCPE